MKSYGLYLEGRWQTLDEIRDVIDPGNGAVIGRVAFGSRREAAAALACAQTALPAWSRAATARDRGRFLFRLADTLEARAEEFSHTITLENGKPLAQARAETAAAIDHVRWFAEEARRAYGRVIPPQAAGKRHFVFKSPVGVVAAIAPWNFPLMLTLRKVAPALAAGCPVVLKPATKTPLSAALFAECCAAIDLPKGVFQFVLGPAADIAAEFLENPICRKITFTGSTEVGRALIRGAAAAIKPLSLELGGHAPALVFEDADLDRAVEALLQAKFRNSGQSCIAANRIYVQRGIFDAFVDRFAERVRAFKVGHGLEAGVDIGPLVDAAALGKALQHIVDAQERGAKLVCGGRKIERGAGFFLEPTVLTDVAPGSQCLIEETFAPVAPLLAFDTEAEAVQNANASEYGLSAYLFTENLDRAWRVAEQLEAGSVGVNDGVLSTSQSPFGGCKQSGWGRELGSEGMEAFLETKHVSLMLRAAPN